MSVIRKDLRTARFAPWRLGTLVAGFLDMLITLVAGFLLITLITMGSAIDGHGGYRLGF